VKVINNSEHQEAEAIKQVIDGLCKRYSFIKASVAFGDMEGRLFFFLTGFREGSADSQTVLVLVDQK